MNYRPIWGLLFIGLLTLLTACGTTGSSSSSQGGQMMTTTPASQMGQTSTNSLGRQTVNVMLYDDHMSSSLMSFATGTPYHFVVTNHGQQPYAFTMMDQNREQDMSQMPMAQRHQAALYMNDRIAPGQTLSFDYTFGSSMMGQHLEFACYQQGSNQVHTCLPFMMQS
jgi:uncharacterized cupredoxin-like copper-binding protein